MHYSCIMLENMIVLILLSKQMLKLWSWKTRKGHGKGHYSHGILKSSKGTNPDLQCTSK